jgi:hypothetical protein
MKRSCLYIAFFTKLNHYDCVGLSGQIAGDLICVFNNEIFYSKYYNVLSKNKNKIKIIHQDPLMSEIIDTIKNNYTHIAYLHNTKLIIDSLNIDAILKKSENNALINHVMDEKDKCVITFFKSSNNINLIKNKITFYSFVLSPKNIFKTDSQKIRLSNYYYDLLLDEENEIKKNNKIYYEDNNCIFAIFDKKDSTPLARSPCYVNKHNKKIYSTTNFCVGAIISSSKEKYQIKWLYNNILYDCEYIYDKETEQFI